LENVLNPVAAADGDVAAWQRAVSVLRRRILPYLVNREDLGRAEDLWQQARVLIEDVALRAQARRQFQAQQQAATLQEISQTVRTSFDMAELLDVLARDLPRMGIPSGYLSLYEGNDVSRLMLAYDERARAELEPAGRRLPSRQLVPDELLPAQRQYSMVVHPLYFRDEPFGFVVFEPGPRDSTVYEILRAQLSSALKGILLLQERAASSAERERLLAALEHRALQLQTAAEVSHAASSILNVDELLPQVAELIRDRFNLYYVGLFLMAEAGRDAVLRAGTGEAGRKMLEAGHKFDVSGVSMIGWCIANGTARIALDVGQEAVRFENPLLPQTRSELALPLISRGQTLGALTIQSTQEAAFSEGDISLLQTMADGVANAIKNAQLFEQTQVALQEAEATRRRYLQQAWPEYIRTMKTAGYETGRPGTAPLGDAVWPEIQQAVERGGATVVAGPDSEEQQHTALVAPIALRGVVIGALGIHADEGTRQWTADEITLVQAIAERMALAAESLRLLDETQRRAVRERLIRGITDQIRAAVTVEDAVQRAVREMARVLGAAEAVARIGTAQDLLAGREG
jgi:GAF domain-containing protein